MSTLDVVRTLSAILFFFNDTATTEIYTLSLHDALPISTSPGDGNPVRTGRQRLGSPHGRRDRPDLAAALLPPAQANPRSEEHTSELQSRQYLVCRLLLEKKK